MEQQIIANGGVQYVPQIAVQYVYLDFDGELPRYNGEILTIDNVEVQDSSLTEERIKNILTELNAKYAAQNVIFVTERPVSAEYSTIYIGKTSVFDQYGSFAGLAETIDHGNENKSDNAFVMLDSSSSDKQIISTISHEINHLLGTLDHGGEGLAAYADDHSIAAGITSDGLIINSNDRLIDIDGYASDVTIMKNGEVEVGYGETLGKIYNTTIEAGGTLYLSSTAIAGGYLQIEKGATVEVEYGAKIAFTVSDWETAS